MLRAIPVDVVVRTNGLLQLVADDETRAFRRWASSEHHDPRTGVREGRLEKTHGDADGNSSATERTLVVRNRPRITRKRLQDTRELKLTLLNRHEEACSAESLRRHRLTRTGRSTVLRAQSKHILDLLRCVLLAPAEHV